LRPMGERSEKARKVLLVDRPMKNERSKRLTSGEMR
jgi:hypothetical protein